MGGGANAGAEAEAGAEADSGAATEGANTDSEAGDGGDDARVAVGATLAGGGAGAIAEGAIAAAGEAFDGERNCTYFLCPSGDATRVGTVGRDTAAVGGNRDQYTEGAQITDAG